MMPIQDVLGDSFARRRASADRSLAGAVGQLSASMGGINDPSSVAAANVLRGTSIGETETGLAGLEEGARDRQNALLGQVASLGLAGRSQNNQDTQTQLARESQAFGQQLSLSQLNEQIRQFNESLRTTQASTPIAYNNVGGMPYNQSGGPVPRYGPGGYIY